MFCIFSSDVDGRCVCDVCKIPDQLGKSACDRISRPCRGEQENRRPPIVRRFWSFAKAWVMHLTTGRPATPSHLREMRLSICSNCPHLVDGVCNKCGCPIKDKDVWVTSKLSMAGQRCPLHPPKWGPVELAPSLGIAAWLNRLGRLLRRDA